MNIIKHFTLFRPSEMRISENSFLVRLCIPSKFQINQMEVLALYRSAKTRSRFDYASM